MIYIIQNHPEVPAGIYGELLKTARIPFQTIRPDLGESLPAPQSATAVIVLGGYMGVHDEGEFPFLVELKTFIRDGVAADVPFFGICLGGQLLADVLGGEVTAKERGEKGLCQLTLTAAGQSDPLFAGVPSVFTAFQWHNDSFALPSGAHLLASSADCPGQAFRYGRAWGVQFHPEVDLEVVRSWSRESYNTAEYQKNFSLGEIELRSFGTRLLGNFLAIAGC
jgi:GMP synthase-like glutamine amidotransferase